MSDTITLPVAPGVVLKARNGTPADSAWDFAAAQADILAELKDRRDPAPVPRPLFAGLPPPAAPLTAPTRPRPSTSRKKRKEAPLPPPAPPEPIFDRAALYRPAEGEREVGLYRMPGGGILYPHPLSGGERKFVNVQVALHLQRLYGERAQPTNPEEQGQRGMEWALDAEILGDIWHAVVCARVGPAPTEARVFADEDAEAFYRNPGWEEAAQEIAALSRAAGRGVTEAGMLREALRGFFGATQATLDWCASQLDIGSLEPTALPSSVAEVKATLRNCASLLLPWTQPGRATAADLETLAGSLEQR